MSEYLELEMSEGVFVRVYAQLSGGVLSCMVRATNKTIFDQQCLSAGLKVYTNPAQPAVVDPETQEVITPAVEASGPLIPAKGVTITEMGPLTLIPAILDEEGNVITPATMDNRYHANFWLSSEVVQRRAWEQWAVLWTAYGQPVDPNNSEEAVVYGGIELIDPTTVTSPSNVLL